MDRCGQLIRRLPNAWLVVWLRGDAFSFVFRRWIALALRQFPFYCYIGRKGETVTKI